MEVRMEGDRISHHESVRMVYERIKKDGMDNIWDRYEAQGLGSPDKRCPFCQAGVRCDLCSNGPCRADAAKDKKGVCGIKAISRCDFAEADFNRKLDEPSMIVEALAPKERKERWRKLDIFPGGIHGEILFATSSCLTNVDGYYQSLALKAMRLGVAVA